MQNIFPEGYEIIERIGEGGTSEVFLARLDGSPLPVALKLFFDQSSSKLRERELEVSRKINFPGIIKIQTSGKTTDNRDFLQMEYCAGPTLEQLPGRVSERKLLSILSAIAASLNVLHQAGYNHNDLKPANIFCPVGFDDTDFFTQQPFYLKLVDLSLATRHDQEHGKSITGTVGYMSPEMILKKEIGPTSDMFSLGVIAYYLACGKLPFISANNDPLEINSQVTEGDRPQLCGPGLSFSEKISELITSLLDVNSKKRPSSAFELLERLSRVGSPYLFRKAIRPRHLLWDRATLNSDVLEELFGQGSFTKRHCRFLEKTTSYDYASLRILLEHNFDCANFARLDGRWGWTSESSEAIAWSRRQTLFSLRPLRGQPASLKHLALAVAVADDPDSVEAIAGMLSSDPSQLLERWAMIPEDRLPSLLYSLQMGMTPSTRRVLSNRLIDLFKNNTESSDKIGRLLFDAGKFDEAISPLLQSAEKAKEDYKHDEAFVLLETALTAARRSGDILRQTKVIFQIARVHHDLGQFQEAEDRYKELVEIASENELKEQLAEAYTQLGDIYRNKSDYSAGIDALNSALDLLTELNEKAGLAVALNNLGNLYRLSGDLDQALDNYQKSFDILKELGSEEKRLATILDNIGTIYFFKGSYTAAIEYFNRSLELQEALGDKRELARTWNNLANAHFYTGKAVSALEAFNRSLSNHKEIGAQTGQLFNIENIAEVMIQIGRLNGALEYLKEGSELAAKLGDESHQSFFSQLTGQLLRRMGYYADAEKNLLEAERIAGKLESHELQLPCYVSLSRLYLGLNDIERAERYLEKATGIARRLGEKIVLFHLALIKFALTDDDKYQIRAEQLLLDLNAPREKALYHLVSLERNNDRNSLEDSRLHMSSVAEFYLDDTEDIDKARFHLACARYYFLTNKIENAIASAEKSLHLSNNMGILPEQWQSSCFLSEIMFLMNGFEKSFYYAKKATDILKKVTSKFNDSKRLGRFYNDQRIINLLGRIKSLQTVLNEKKEDCPRQSSTN